CSGSRRPIDATSTPATLRRVYTLDPGYRATGWAPLRTPASTVACSHTGATVPYVCPRCSAHSPNAYTPGTSVASRSFTVTARPTERPDARATSTRGRTPHASTTTSAGTVVPSSRTTAVTRVAPRTAVT